MIYNLDLVMSMRKFVVIFMVVATLAVTVLLLYSIWTGFQNDLFWKALSSYLVITISLYLTTKYIDILDRKKADKTDED